MHYILSVILQASPADYDAIPIECYGMAMLRGMGFDPKAEKGKRYG